MAGNPRAIIVITYKNTGNGVVFLGISHDILEPERLEEVALDWLRIPATETVFAITYLERGFVSSQTNSLEEALVYLRSQTTS